jgi:predicted transposase YbfD/YdcC
VERRYYLSSLPLDPARMARLVRGHWSIENSLHWVMDVTFGEDRNRTRLRRAAQNLALLRRLAFNLCKLDTLKDSVKGKKFRAACSDAYLAKLINLHA